MVSLMVVELDKLLDLDFQLTRQVLVLQQAIFQSYPKSEGDEVYHNYTCNQLNHLFYRTANCPKRNSDDAETLASRAA